MPKMTKAQARKRLGEAQKKVLAVWLNRQDDLTKSDNGKMLLVIDKLDEIIKKLK